MNIVSLILNIILLNYNCLTWWSIITKKICVHELLIVWWLRKSRAITPSTPIRLYVDIPALHSQIRLSENLFIVCTSVTWLFLYFLDIVPCRDNSFSFSIWQIISYNDPSVRRTWSDGRANYAQKIMVVLRRLATSLWNPSLESLLTYLIISRGWTFVVLPLETFGRVCILQYNLFHQFFNRLIISNCWWLIGFTL